MNIIEIVIIIIFYQYTIKYYNFNKIKPYNDSLFYDSEHLNQNGVKKFNFNLLKVLNTEDK